MFYPAAAVSSESTCQFRILGLCDRGPARPLDRNWLAFGTAWDKKLEFVTRSQAGREPESEYEMSEAQLQFGGPVVLPTDGRAAPTGKAPLKQILDEMAVPAAAQGRQAG